MSYFKGIVPKYLLIYSVIKLVLVLRDISSGVLSGLGYKGYYFGTIKVFLNAMRIFGLKYIHSQILFNLTIVSIMFEACFFIYEKTYFARSRIIAEIAFGLVSAVFVVFFHPFYCRRSIENTDKKD